MQYEYIQDYIQAKISVNAPPSTTVPNKNDLKPILDILEVDTPPRIWLVNVSIG